MKYLISFFLSLFFLASNAQGPVVPGTVQTVTALKAYYGPVNKMYVVATNSDYVICSPCTVDEVRVFAGAGGRKWKRQVPSSIPQDSIAGLSTTFAGKIGVSDTAGFRGTDRNYALTLANLRLLKTDTAAARATDRAYAAGLASGKLNISDTAGFRNTDRIYANNRALNHIENFRDTATAEFPISLYPNLGDTIPTRGDAIRRMRDSLWVAVQDSVDYPLDSLLTIGLNIPPTSKIVRSKLDSVANAIAGKQAALVSGTTIKTLNGTSLLGPGDISISAGGTVDQTIINGSTNAVAGDPVFDALAEKANISQLPVVATPTEVNMGSDNAKFISASALSTSKYLTSDGSKQYVTTAGTSTVFTATLSPAPAALTTGMQITLKMHLANTGASTLNVNGLGAASIVKEVSTALASGDLPINKIVTLVYNGTQWQLTSPFSDVLKANVASPALSGTPTAPTPAVGTNTTQIATSAMVTAVDSKNLDTTANISGAATKASATWATGTVTVNSNTQRHDILITATGARTLVVSNINNVRSVVMWIDNTSGATIALTLPANSFLQNATTGIYGSATSVTLAQGKTVLTLSNYDGTNHWFNY